ncbi:hypothetical protein WJX79_005088 [Trebouxia sp. C0005]
MLSARAIPQYQATKPLCCARSLLNSRDLGATRSFNSLQVSFVTKKLAARTSQVHHRVRRLIIYAQKLRKSAQCPHESAHAAVCFSSKEPRTRSSGTPNAKSWVDTSS